MKCLRTSLKRSRNDDEVIVSSYIHYEEYSNNNYGNIK